jgi:hypothetical protein
MGWNDHVGLGIDNEEEDDDMSNGDDMIQWGREMEDAILKLEYDNQQLRVALKWACEQLDGVDHDCKAAPDDGCEFCCQLWYAESLLKEDDNAQRDD